MIIDGFFQDLRVGARVLAKEKSFCVLAATVLALGICGVATMYSVVNGVMLRGFSFPNADRMAYVQFIDRTQSNFFGFANQILALDFEDLRAEQRSFDYVAAYLSGSTVNATIDGNPRRYTGAYVTSDFFRILGVAPVIGRDFSAADNAPGAEKVTLISHQLWQRDFGGRREVVGKGVRLNGRPATVIGVMPPGFAFPSNEELWIPLFSEFPPRPRNDQRAVPPTVVGLLKAGVSCDQASAECTAIAKRLAEAFPDTNKKYNTALVEPLVKAFTPPVIRGLLWTMLAFCGGLLLMACVNVMNMQFARAALRMKELAIRSSLGATRVRLIRQMLTESLLLAALGAIVGIGLAGWAVDFLDTAAHNQAFPLPAHIRFDIDRAVLLFVVAATVVAAVSSGFVPAWMSSRTSAVEALKESGRGHTSRAVGVITRGLVVFQILITCVLLIGSLLEAQTIVRQQRIDYGYDTDALLTARMGLMDGDYPTPEARKLFYDRLLPQLRASPEFASVALTTRLRMAVIINGPGFTPIEIEGRTYKTDEDRPNANYEQISDGYFDTLGAKLREGRDFRDDDSDAREPVAIVNSAFAKKYFGHESALGRRFRTVANNGRLFGPWRTIVGVTGDMRMQPPFNIPNVDDTGFYLPLFATALGPVSNAPFSQQFATVVVRPRGTAPPQTVNAALQREVKKVDPNLPLYFIGTPREGQDTFIAQNRIIGTMFTVFGVVAVVLSAVGLYGVMSFSVNQRTQEFGIRMALGADNRQILRMVLRQGAIQLGLGLMLGLGLTVLAATLFGAGISNALFQTSPRDPLTYTAVAALVTLVSLVATLVPARRATRVDPMVALRSE